MAIDVEVVRTTMESRLNITIGENNAILQINEALLMISKLANWPDLYTSGDVVFAATNQSKALPSDCRHVGSCVIAGYRPLTKVRFPDIEIAQQQPSPTTGRPRVYATKGKALYVFAIPDGDYTVAVSYWKTHTAIADEEGTVEFSDDFKEMIITRSIVEYLKANGKTVHPKLLENDRLFNEQVSLMMPTADFDHPIIRPFIYGVS